MEPMFSGPAWERDCLHYHNRVLKGAQRHYCYDWNMLPIDETVPEIQSCVCGVVLEPLP